MRVGVQQSCFVAHDADMAAPEYDIAAPQAGKVRIETERRADRFFLQIGIARHGHPGRVERNLHEPRAIDAEARLAAPEIGRVQKPLGHRDEVFFALFVGFEMIGEDESIIADLREGALRRANANGGPERRGTPRWHFQVGTLIDKCPVDRDTMGRLRVPLCKRGRGDIADVAVPRELDPAPAFLILVKHELFAKQRLRIERGIMGWLALQIGDADDNLHRTAFDIIGGRDETTQMCSRKIGPGGGQAGVELCHLPLIAGCGADGNWSVLRQRGGQRANRFCKVQDFCS